MRHFFIFIFLCSLACGTTTTSNVEEIASSFQKTLAKHGVKLAKVEGLKDKEEISVSSLTVDLRNPNFTDGMLVTTEGGVIKNNDLRIQAKNIQYTKKKSSGQRRS